MRAYDLSVYYFVSGKAVAEVKNFVGRPWVNRNYSGIVLGFEPWDPLARIPVRSSTLANGETIPIMDEPGGLTLTNASLEVHNKPGKLMGICPEKPGDHRNALVFMTVALGMGGRMDSWTYPYPPFRGAVVPHVVASVEFKNPVVGMNFYEGMDIWQGVVLIVPNATARLKIVSERIEGGFGYVDVVYRHWKLDVVTDFEWK